MAFTQTQLDALDAAIAEGVLQVQFEDKRVTYDSFEAMLKRRNFIYSQLNSGNTATAPASMLGGRRVQTSFDSGASNA